MVADFRTSFVREPNSLRHHPALVLNADYRPLSYYPLSLWPWQEAVKAAFLDRVSIVAEYDAVVRSPTTEIRIPSVVVLKDYVKPQKRVAFTRFNLFLRDEFRCQYCGSTGDLTFDHVVPRARGGRTSWENMCSAGSILFACGEAETEAIHSQTVSCWHVLRMLGRPSNMLQGTGRESVRLNGVPA